MSILLDTTVLIDVGRGRAATTRWLEAQDAGAIFLSTVTVGELCRGLHHRLAAGSQALADALDVLHSDTLIHYAGRILAFDHAAAQVWGRMTGEALAAGRPIPTDDAKIAAIAVTRGMRVATSNTRHYDRLVPTIDPRYA